MARLKDTEINGNLVVTGDILNKDGVDLTTAFSNPNLLINSDFRNPINQRGQTTYTLTSNNYTIDRWIFGNGTLSMVDKGVQITNTSGFSTFMQRLEEDYRGEVLTVSMLYEIDGTTKTFSHTFAEIPDSGNLLVNVDDNIECYIYYRSAHGGISLEYHISNTIIIHWIKLEQGYIATPFVPRSYGEEFLLCQRYYQIVTPPRKHFAKQNNNNAAIESTIEAPYKMRINPTITSNFSSVTAYTYNGGSAISLTSRYGLTCAMLNNGQIEIYDVWLANTTANAIVSMYYTSNTMAFYLDAEIY